MYTCYVQLYAHLQFWAATELNQSNSLNASHCIAVAATHGASAAGAVAPILFFLLVHNAKRGPSYWLPQPVSVEFGWLVVLDDSSVSAAVVGSFYSIPTDLF